MSFLVVDMDVLKVITFKNHALLKLFLVSSNVGP